MRSHLLPIAVLSFSFAVAATAHAQPRAMYNPSAAGGWGAQTYRPHTARTYSRQAIGHAQTLQYYGRSNASVAQGTAQEHATEIRRCIDAFAKEITKLPKEWENDPEALKLITEIRNHQKEAAAQCGMLETECAKQMAAGGTVADCCGDMLKHLRAADAAHDKLMKYLKVPSPDDAAPGATNPDAKK